MKKSDYFGFEQTDENIWRISEKKGVGEYVIVGDNSALLIDTGFGGHNLSSYIKENITEKPLTVVNSHYHPDHSGSNSEFPHVYIEEADIPDGHNTEFEQLLGCMKDAHSLLGAFAAHMFKVPDPTYKIIPMHDGDEFDLGSRTVRVMAFPGHTKGSVLFLDKKTRTVFTNDSCNAGTWLFTNREQKIPEYSSRVRQLPTLLADYTKFTFAHSPNVVDSGFFTEYADMLDSIDMNKVKKVKARGLSEPVCIFGKNTEKYGKINIMFFGSQLK